MKEQKKQAGAAMLELLFLKYRNQIYNIAFSILHDEGQAEDPFQPMEAYHQMMDYQEQITALKETLPPHYWEMLEHRYMMEKSVAEISEICGLDVENVYSRLRRAKKKAREILVEKEKKEEAICIKKKYSCI